MQRPALAFPMAGTVVLCTMLLCGGAALAASSRADQNFAAMAAQAGQAEFQAGQLAQQSAAMPRLRQFGQTLVTNYSQYDDQLQQIAQQENLNLPAQPTTYQHALGQRLTGMNGDSFDRQFLTQEVRAQEGYLIRFQQEARSGHDPALKDFASKNLPMLRQQLRMVQMLQNQLPDSENTWHGQD